ncbi:MAG: MarR family transcriptional regulator [Anaerolineae bacterium]|nr:MarR family transcriptional regulator [Candidatus Roseilinea sp.]MDW8450797.1 MarR family transcriptional regulator [Anaerolineae bacterium]
MFNQAVADQLGINTTDLGCLDTLVRNAAKPMTPSKLAELTGLSGGAITDAIDRLERAGFVVRASTFDHRLGRVLLRLTPVHTQCCAALRRHSDGHGQASRVIWLTTVQPMPTMMTDL